jgi:hypothetical protein
MLIAKDRMRMRMRMRMRIRRSWLLPSQKRLVSVSAFLISKTPYSYSHFLQAVLR